MSKSVLVIDTPENCKSCIHISTFRAFCRINCRDIKDTSAKPDWCPLKPLPERIGSRDTGHEYNNGYADGWDECIDEITGGE